MKALNSLLIACVFALSLACLFQIKLIKVNLALLLLSFLMFRSLLAQMDELTFAIFLKVISAILLFFMAQFAARVSQTINLIALSYIVPALYVIFLAAIGQGYQYWGAVHTFVGPYYYKTDLAIMVILSIIFFRRFLFFGSSVFIKRIAAVYILLIAPKLILMANSRMTLIVYAVILIGLVVEFFRYHDVKFSSFKRNLIIFYSLIVFFGGYLFYVNRYISEDALVIDMNSEQIFSASNTQGRSEIWGSITDRFFEGKLLNILFGYSMMKDHEFDVVLHADSHNAWLKVMISCGLAGLFLYMLMLGLVVHKLRLLLRQYRDRRNDYFVLMTIALLLSFYLLSGISQSNLIFTQSSWYAFYFMGLLFNKRLFPLPDQRLPERAWMRPRIGEVGLERAVVSK
jgi:hypothetical protein